MSRNTALAAAASSSSSSSAGANSRGRRTSSIEPTPQPSWTKSTLAATRPNSIVRSPPAPCHNNAGPSRSRPGSQARQQNTTATTTAQAQLHQQHQQTKASTSSQSPTPTSSAASSRRSSIVLDTSAYRYSLNVGSISRFPTSAGAGASGSGAKEILNAQSNTRNTPRIASKENNDVAVLTVDPSRASVSSTSSRASSRISSRYMAEEVAPQRRPIYLALPSDPSALGPWSSTNSTLIPSSHHHGNKASDKDSKLRKEGADQKGGGERRNSKIMTSFPFPHPVTPRRRGDRGGGNNGNGGVNGAGGRGGGKGIGIGAAWQRLLNAIFAGPYERQLNREEQEDDRITASIIQDIAQRNSSNPHPSHTVPGVDTTTTTSNTTNTKYGTIPIPNDAIQNNSKTLTKTSTMNTTTATFTSDSAHSETEDLNDPYGYRRLAGPHLLPSYTTDLVARRRERRRARSRARFQCMALWTIWTVSVILIIIVAVLLFSFLFPDRLNVPSHHDDGSDDDNDGDEDHFMGFAITIAIAKGALASIYNLTLVLVNSTKALTAQ
ncbi:uncharacterized protein MEPE_02297 [Melanopsichium pennsylvanicum]|uniref:Uncharacterized protein n=1 Tax=Melanopsichium pennsylvanicum TaxID=63383 RepID=A0AAJ4XK20_9BASI|nr:uncharacterized protein MEPE_02297 [Melanopsichium pennsylvanicum]